VAGRILLLIIVVAFLAEGAAVVESALNLRLILVGGLSFSTTTMWLLFSHRLHSTWSLMWKSVVSTPVRAKASLIILILIFVRSCNLHWSQTSLVSELHLGFSVQRLKRLALTSRLKLTLAEPGGFVVFEVLILINVSESSKIEIRSVLIRKFAHIAFASSFIINFDCSHLFSRDLIRSCCNISVASSCSIDRACVFISNSSFEMEGRGSLIGCDLGVE